MSKEYVDWTDINKFVFEDLKDSELLKNKTYVYGLPRGGLSLAVMFSHAFDLKLLIISPQMTSFNVKNVLIVDDISDKGNTLFEYYEEGFDIITYAYHKQSIVIPKIWKFEKKESWLVFPWEELYV